MTCSPILPVFVYGTLRRGYRNHGLVSHLISHVEEAELKDSIRSVYHFRRGGFPGLFLTRESSSEALAATSSSSSSSSFLRLRGELLHPRPGCEAEMMTLLDALEEYYGPDDDRNEYERRVVQVVKGPPLAGPAAPALTPALTFACVHRNAVEDWDGIPVEPMPPKDAEGGRSSKATALCWASFVETHGLPTAGSDWCDMPDVERRLSFNHKSENNE